MVYLSLLFYKLRPVIKEEYKRKIEKFSKKKEKLTEEKKKESVSKRIESKKRKKLDTYSSKVLELLEKLEKELGIVEEEVNNKKSEEDIKKLYVKPKYRVDYKKLPNIPLEKKDTKDLYVTLLKILLEKKTPIVYETSSKGLDNIYKRIVEEKEAEVYSKVAEIKQAGIELPKLVKKKKRREIDLRKIREEYNLIEWEYNNEKFVLARALIKWDNSINALKYYVLEEKLNQQEEEILEKLTNFVKEKIELEKINVEREELVKEALDLFKRVLENFYGKKLTNFQKAKIVYYFYRNSFGLERVEPLMHDPNLEDISCDGVNIPIFVYHSKPNYGSLETNIVFKTREELDAFIYRLAQLAGKSISIANPLLDGILPDGSRVQATLGSDIARRGSNFTIRKFRQRILTPIDLIEYGTADENIFTYLWFLIETFKSILIAGPTASGKTTFLNAISLFIKPEAKIVTIEDTPEIRIPHPNWIPLIERRIIGKEKYYEVTMYDLLRAALRQRPDYIIVGEVRGKEANVMFHAMETGHGALATIHAEDLNSLVDRLTSPPIEIPLPRIQALDAVVFLTRKAEGRTIKRRVLNIQEIVGYDRRKGELIVNKSFEWIIDKDVFKPYKSILMEKVRKYLGLSKEEFKYEYLRRMKLLRWLRENNIKDYREFFKYIRQYYFYPDFVEELEIKENA